MYNLSASDWARFGNAADLLDGVFFFEIKFQIHRGGRRINSFEGNEMLFGSLELMERTKWRHEYVKAF